jgi:5,10-methylenetetrahydromethanopterin reductase
MRPVRFGVGIYTAEPLTSVVQQAKLAERLGYDSLWLLDSQLVGREVYATMAMCALETERIKIGSGVAVPYTRHATVTACAFATLDELAHGRFLLGIGRGDSAVLGIGGQLPKFREFGTYVDQVERLLRGEQIEINGKPIRLQFLDRSRLPDAPTYVAVGGPRAIEFGCSIANRIIVHSGAGEVMINRAMDLVRGGARKAGKDLANMEIVWWVHASIDDDWSKVKEHYRPRMVGKFRHTRPVDLEELGVHLDAETIERAKNSYNFVDHATAGAAHGVWADLFPDPVWKQVALLGTARECYETVRKGLESNPEISHFVINPPPSGFGITVEGVMETFAKDIAARLRSEAALARLS